MSGRTSRDYRVEIHREKRWGPWQWCGQVTHGVVRVEGYFYGRTPEKVEAKARRAIARWTRVDKSVVREFTVPVRVLEEEGSNHGN